MTALDIEIALMRYYGITTNLIVPNVSWGMDLRHECDVLVLSKAGYATEIEIKVSKSDLIKDREKLHNHSSEKIKYLYFAVPEKLKQVALENIMDRAGLLVVKETSVGGRIRRNVELVRKASQSSTQPYKWSDRDRSDLGRLGALRILGLKQKIQRLKAENKRLKMENKPK